MRNSDGAPRWWQQLSDVRAQKGDAVSRTTKWLRAGLLLPFFRFFLIPFAIYGNSLWRVMKVSESRENPIFRSRSIYLFSRSMHRIPSAQCSSRVALCRRWWRSEDVRQRLSSFLFSILARTISMVMSRWLKSTGWNLIHRLQIQITNGIKVFTFM